MIKLHGMGVINMTPDSFSDGGRCQDTAHLKAQIARAHSCGVDWLDVGAQSTAPGRSACGPEQEWQRLQGFLAVTSEIPERWFLSVDTYWPEVAVAFTQQMARERPDLTVMWNDVSGCLDQALLDYLQTFPRAHAIVGLAPMAPGGERAQAQTHWQREDFFTPDTVIAQARHFFQQVRRQLAPFQGRYWIDPLFGFGKDADTSWALWRGLNEFVGPTDALVLGISRKRFLRAPLALQAPHISNDDLFRASDLWQLQLLTEALRLMQDRQHSAAIAVRIHELSLLPALQCSLRIKA